MNLFTGKVAALSKLLIFALAAFFLTAPVLAQHDLKKVPEFQVIRDLDGNNHTRSTFKGRHTLIVFFSVYSDDSAELMAFAESAGADSELNVVSVNIDPSADEVKDFLKDSAVVHPVILDLSLKMTGAFRIRKVPTIFLVGPDLQIMYSAEGFDVDDKQALLQALQKIPGEEPAITTDDELSKKFNKKFLVSPDAKVAGFSPGERPLVLYISGDSDLWVYDPVADERHSIATRVGSADWDPAGDRVVFSQIDKPGLWWKEIGAEKAVRITPFGARPAWSPDGAFIAFHVHDNEVWVYNIEKKKRWRVPIGGVSVSWSRDGKLLLVRGGGKTSIISPWAKMSLLKSLHK